MVLNSSIEISERHYLLNRRKMDLFSELRQDFKDNKLGFIGDFNQYALGYVSMASVLNAQIQNGVARPVGSFVIGKPSSGKTQFLESLTTLFPEEIVINLTSTSARALLYQCKADPYYLNGKIIFVEELLGISDESIQYLLRILMTKGLATHETVISGKHQQFKIFGKISLQSTGLHSDILRDDTMSRLIIFESNATDIQTRKVIDNIAERYIRTSQGLFDAQKYKDFFSSLIPYGVSIPFAKNIQFNLESSAARRSSKIFFDLLTTIALINQDRRKVENGVLIAEEEDLDLLLEFSKKEKKEFTGKLNYAETQVWNKCVDIIIEGKKKFTYNDVLNLRPAGIEGNIYKIGAIKKALDGLIKKGLIASEANTRPKYFKVLGEDSLTNRFMATKRNVL